MKLLKSPFSRLRTFRTVKKKVAEFVFSFLSNDFSFENIWYFAIIQSADG